MDVGFSWLEPDTPKIQSCSLKSQQDNPALLGGYQLETKGCLPFLLPFTDLSFSHFLFSLRDILLLTVVEKKTLRALLELKPSYANFYFQTVHH